MSRLPPSFRFATFLGCLVVIAGARAATGADADQRAFSADQVARLWERHAPESRPPTVVAENELEIVGPTIELEPYYVKGEPNYLKAWVRRELTLDPPSMQRRLEQLSPYLNLRAQYQGRASEQFFSASSPGRPSGAAEVVQVPLLAAPTIVRDFGDWMESRFNLGADR